MKRTFVFFTFLLLFTSLPFFSEGTTENLNSGQEISNQENEEDNENSKDIEKPKIKIREDILDEEEDPNKELFKNIPNPFYEEGISTEYDDEPITFLGINARWLSDKLPNHELNHIFSFDFIYTLTALQNNGIGLGLNYEQKIWRYFSLKGQLGTIISQIPDSYTWYTGIRAEMSSYLYPFGKGLEWLYAGCGIGADFLFYTGDYAPMTPNDIIFCATPTIGWKQFFFKKVMTDVNLGYRFIINKTENYEFNEDLIPSGFQIGFKIKIFWTEILKSMLDRRIRLETAKRKNKNNQ